jgi:eukaryotic-like serine/threonine-protein kinase
LLSVGADVTLMRSGRRARVGRFIGEGSQGAVFEARLEETGEAVAVKWYAPSLGHAAQRAAIEALVDRGAPDERFLWPSELVSCPGSASFGYAMPLRPPAYAGLADLLSGRVDVPFSTVCTLGMGLADSFLKLHNEGLCYRDISFGNLFFDPGTGRPLICDNDNVGVNGASPSAVLGTRRFMAPEIVRREALPSTDTDLYSLAVLLFYLLMVGHPLVGRRELDFPTWDDRAEVALFGEEPRFVFDPSDPSNEPVAHLHEPVISNWELHPPFVRALFVQAFTAGLGSPSRRVRESQWRRAMAQLRDAVLRCPACGKESYWHADSPPATCWACRRALERPVRLVVAGRPLVLNVGTEVVRHHLAGDYDFERRAARVVVHPGRADRWGLRNEGADPWTAELPGGGQVEIGPGQALGLLPGTRVTLAGVPAEIVR